MLLWLAIVTGARRGELCALRWDQLDFAASVLSIKSSITQHGAKTREKDSRGRTALTGGPPYRSQRAELPHWAPGSGQPPSPGTMTPGPDVHEPAHVTHQPGTASGARFASP